MQTCSYVDLGIVATDFPDIKMHPTELLKTPFGPVCLVKPFLYSEIDEPVPRLVNGHPLATLTIDFKLHTMEELTAYNLDQYKSGIFQVCLERLNGFGTFILSLFISFINENVHRNCL